MKALYIMVAIAAISACDRAEHHKDAAETYHAGNLPDADRTLEPGSPTSDACRRALECYGTMARDLCSDDQCTAALAPPPGNSDQGTCANAVREARLRATPYTRFRSDYHLPEPCRL